RALAARRGRPPADDHLRRRRRRRRHPRPSAAGRPVAVRPGAGHRRAGVLPVGPRHGATAFPQALVDVVASFAAQAGVALELAASRAEAERVSLYEDRDRIARDLHDLVIQRLYATGMSLEG